MDILFITPFICEKFLLLRKDLLNFLWAGWNEYALAIQK